MFTVVQQSPDKAQLKLIREHPELAGKEAETGQLTEESTREQRGAGLDQCTAQELQQLRDLNQAYRQRFGFPFVIAVTGLNRHDILQHLQQRLANEPKQEQQTSIQQIGRIAAIRLQQLIAD
jgi:2-oxo-4-hydroxy-4-carboxy-5-ureidoimidazoline decarboxylase